MNDLIKNITPSELQQISTRISDGVGSIIEQSKRTIAVYLNSEVSITYWKIGKYIAGELDAIGEEEHIELLMLDEQNIKVAQYLSVLPEKQWFIDKMNRSIAIARELQDWKEEE